jgi:hypothetical protein
MKYALRLMLMLPDSDNTDETPGIGLETLYGIADAINLQAVQIFLQLNIAS